jgi:hypothetical protein
MGFERRGHSPEGKQNRRHLIVVSASFQGRKRIRKIPAVLCGNDEDFESSIKEDQIRLSYVSPMRCLLRMAKSFSIRDKASFI